MYLVPSSMKRRGTGFLANRCVSFDFFCQLYQVKFANKAIVFLVFFRLQL